MNIIKNEQRIEEINGKVVLTQTVVTEYEAGQWEKDKKGKYHLYPFINEVEKAREVEP